MNDFLVVRPFYLVREITISENRKYPCSSPRALRKCKRLLREFKSYLVLGNIREAPFFDNVPFLL